MKASNNIIAWSMRNFRITFLIIGCLFAFGVYALVHIPKQEFPEYTIRQGVVVGLYPGATTEEVEEQLAKPLEQFLMTYKEVKRSKTTSTSQNGMCYVMVELNDDEELYSHSEFGYDSTPIAEETFYPRPFRGRPVEIRLSDELGQEMLEMLVDGDESMEDDDSFREYFKGILLKGSEPTSSIMGFKGQDTLCMMKLYYSTQDYAEHEGHVLDFHLDSTYLFTHVEADFSGTYLDGISGEETSSTATGNMAFLSGMCGICTKIGFPYLNNLRGIWDHCSAASAELVVHPLPGSYCKQNYSSLPSTLNLYIMDENNISTGGAITGNDGETLQSGSLTYDDMMFPENTYYTYDITDFINDQFGKIGVNKQYLQMIDPEYGYTLDELIIPDRYTTDCQIKLIIKLALYDE